MPRSITFDRFDAGIDLRKGHSVTDANRMMELLNCDITTGFAIAKRPGLARLNLVPADGVGLFVLGNQIKTLVSTDVFGATGRLIALHSALIVGGKLYAVLEYLDQGQAKVAHCYFSEGMGFEANKVVDANCPHSKQVVTLQGKVFAASNDGATVRFSATNKPTDWSTADDAGFLPVSHHGGGHVVALAVYRGFLAVFTSVNVQIWRVDPDPAQHALIDMTHGIGTNYPYSITSVSGDVIFLGHGGIRSLSQQATTGNLADMDIGSAIDLLVAQVLTRNAGARVFGHYSQALGKLLLFVGREVLVYSLSKSASLAAWSRWVLPHVVEAAVDMSGITYLRANNVLYKLDINSYTDDGVVFECRAEMGYMALKQPGMLKRLLGMDVVIKGECEFSVGFDESHIADEIEPVHLTGESRPFDTLPIELHGTAFAPRFRAQHDQPFQVDLITFYYDTAGVR